jgi:regulatory protein
MKMFRKKSSAPLKEPGSYEHGYNYALFLLGIRLYTEGEIREKMARRGYISEVIENVINHLKDLSYIDDARFAEGLLDGFKRFKTYGYYMIKKKMMEKRLPKELIESSLDEHLSVSDELVVAKKYIDKEHLDIAEAGDYNQRQKIAYKLHSRGFRSEIISKLMSGQVPLDE